MVSDSSHRSPNTAIVFLCVATAFIVVPAVFVGALALKQPVNEVEQRRAVLRIETRTKLDAADREKLTTEGWVDKTKGTVRIPISTAMTMVIAELAAKRPAPSTVKVEPPLPMPVIDPAATEPPPAALPSAPQGADTVRFAIPVTAEAVPVPAVAPAPAVPSAPAPGKEANLPETPAAPPSPTPQKPTDNGVPLINPTDNPVPTK